MKSFSETIPSLAGFSRRVGGILLLALLLIPTVDILAGVLVAPTVVFMSHESRTGRLTVQNTTDIPQEVSVHFSFGLPTSDSLGNVSVILEDSVTNPRSCLDWVKAFPRRMILPVGGSQVIRFVARPPQELANAEYWARVVIQSQDAGSNIPIPSEEGAITTKLNMIMQTAVMLKYRHGDMYSELEMTSSSAKLVDGGIDITLDMRSRGNASYVGLLKCQLVDANGLELGTRTIHLAVYDRLRRRFTLPIPAGNPARPFTVEVQISSRGRNDIAAEDMIFGNELTISSLVE